MLLESVSSGAVHEISEAEWQVRVDLAACYRLVAHYGWDDALGTHISARVPGAEEHFLLNPYGMMFGEMRASELVKIDLDGNIITPTPHRVNAAGFTVHSAVHAARADISCVIHLHTMDGVAVSTLARGLLPLAQGSMLLQPHLAYHRYEGVAFNLAERERLQRDLGDRSLMILRNHGTLATGPTVADAFAAAYRLERACTIQIRAMSTGVVLQAVDPDVTGRVEEQSRQIGMESRTNRELAWPALRRMLDRINPGYDA
ncbi:MAG: class II aldolase/adducin family protein [Novosphingobium sp.]